MNIKKDILVSVVIPTWNREKFVLSAIKSVLNQTHQNFEILVCDDGSSDSTKEVVLGLKDKRIKWIEGSHSGLPSVARNRGLLQAKGSYIAFLDSDDTWELSKLEKQIKKMHQTRTKASSSNAKLISKTISVNTTQNLIEFNEEIVTTDDLLKSNHIVCSSLIVDAKTLNLIGLFPEDLTLKVGEDYALWLRLSILTDISFISEKLVKYNDSPKDSVRKYSPQSWILRFYVFKNFFFWLWRNKKEKFLTVLKKFILITLLQILRESSEKRRIFQAECRTDIKKFVNFLTGNLLYLSTFFFKTRYFFSKARYFLINRGFSIYKKMVNH